MASASATSKTMFATGQALLDRVDVPGSMLFMCVAGSAAYNLNTDESDEDYYGVYLADTRRLLSIESNPTDTVTHSTHSVPENAEWQGEGELPDHNFHEVAKFAYLLLKGNYAAVECLFNEGEVEMAEGFAAVVAVRDMFVTTKLLQQYLGYVIGALRRIEEHPDSKPDKRLYYIFRILDEAERIIEGGGPAVNVPDGPKRDFLLSVKAGEHDKDEMCELAQKRLDELSGMNPWPNVRKPSAEAREWLDEWVISLRTAQLNSGSGGSGGC